MTDTEAASAAAAAPGASGDGAGEAQVEEVAAQFSELQLRDLMRKPGGE